MSESIDFVGQPPIDIHDFSSQYGSSTAQNYSIVNICKDQPHIYPSYGDSTNALVFRTYGPWWINLPSYKETKKYFRRFENDFTSRDYIDIEYRELVYPCVSLNIYETYNPGTLEVVYAGKENENGEITWHQVWKFPQPFTIVLKNNQEYHIENGLQRMGDLFPDQLNILVTAFNSLQLNTHEKQTSKIHTHHTYPPAARLPRIVKIPFKNKISFPTRHIRLEFDHCTANYYIEIDTIRLCGQIFNENQSLPVINNQLKKEEEKQIETDIQTSGLIKLPFDLLFLICSLLDLRSLMRLSSTCRYLREQCLHPLQFQSLDLQPYWNGITNHSIENFFLDHCIQTRYLSLAWTKSIEYSPFNQLLDICSDNLIQLNLACCQYLTGEFIESIVNLCPNIEILSFENCHNLSNLDFIPLKNLQHIRTLNVYRTNIDYRTLLPLIDNNKEHLEHINLGSCQNLIDASGIIRLLFSRCSKLRSIDLWRVRNLTPNDYLSVVGLSYDTIEEEIRFANLGMDEQEELTIVYSLVNMPIEIHSITHMTCLSEIDLGWTNIPEGFVVSLVKQAGQCLIKIFLTACRRISNQDMSEISKNCPKLRQLDILGCGSITEATIEEILKRCPDMEFMDVSFCAQISDLAIANWITTYKHIFKRSFEPRNNDDVYAEFP